MHQASFLFSNLLQKRKRKRQATICLPFSNINEKLMILVEYSFTLELGFVTSTEV